jgi:hypothetical protein
LLGLPEDNINLTLFGFIILGAMEAFIFVPLMPILIEALVKEEQKKVGASKKGGVDIQQFSEDEMSDKASSIF